ncbi:uncharacterized protein isoform X4 [Musca autumnalis]|uniref:uncharacterized protein isoform X4 n=1 Tax=Musca autumnalis TaxID=221902 RepID=UPI003CFAFC4A
MFRFREQEKLKVETMMGIIVDIPGNVHADVVIAIHTTDGVITTVVMVILETVNTTATTESIPTTITEAIM